MDIEKNIELLNLKIELLEDINELMKKKHEKKQLCEDIIILKIGIGQIEDKIYFLEINKET
jgi:hypothetical protein